MRAKGFPVMLVLVGLFACWILSNKVEADDKKDLEIAGLDEGKEPLVDRERRWVPEPEPRCRRQKERVCAKWGYRRVGKKSGWWWWRKTRYSSEKYCAKYKWVYRWVCPRRD